MSNLKRTESLPEGITSFPVVGQSPRVDVNSNSTSFFFKDDMMNSSNNEDGDDEDDDDEDEMDDDEEDDDISEEYPRFDAIGETEEEIGNAESPNVDVEAEDISSSVATPQEVSASEDFVPAAQPPPKKMARKGPKESTKASTAGKKSKEVKRDFEHIVSEFAAKPSPPPLPRSASLWRPMQSLLPAGEVLITDVTASDVTITVRECCTSRGFFKEQKQKVEGTSTSSNDEVKSGKAMTTSLPVSTTTKKNAVCEVTNSTSNPDSETSMDVDVKLESNGQSSLIKSTS